MLLQVRSMAEGARNAVLANIVVVSLALLLPCCSSNRPVDDLERTELDRNEFACRQYGFYPGTKQFDDCMKYVGSKQSIFPSPSPR
jgi:hypothetical protein